MISASIELPPDNIRGIIDRLALYVAEEGHGFEQAVMQREQSNPHYRFMFDSKSAEHLYYRWKVISLCSGAKESAWSTEPLQLEANGPRWMPPSCPNKPALRSLSRSPSRSPQRGGGGGSRRSRSRSRSPKRGGGGGGRDKAEKKEVEARVKEAEERRARDQHRPDPRDEMRRSPPPQRDQQRGGGGHLKTRDGRAADPSFHRGGERDLEETERDELEGMLRGLIGERTSIKECMGWCIERSAASDEIVETITEVRTRQHMAHNTPSPAFTLTSPLAPSFLLPPTPFTFVSFPSPFPQALTLKQTPIPKKLARLYLVSDLLHNSSCRTVPRASTYRTRFQQSLPEVFASLHDVLTSLESRMAIETLREQVTKVLHIWQAWSLFPPSLTARLERYFLNGKDGQQQQPQTSSSSSAIAAKATASAGSTASKADDSDEDVDGEPMTTDEYGQPLPPALLQKAQADYAAHALTAKENKVRGLNLRELESVCEASGLSSAGSRAEMQTRILLALRAGAPIDLDPNKLLGQTSLAVASRWDKDEDDGGGGGDGGPGSAVSNAPVASPKAAAASSNKAQAAATAVEEEDIDGEAIDGEDLDGEAIDGSPLNPPKHTAKEQQMINAAKERLDNRGGNRDRDVESRVRDARDRDRPRSRSRERDRGGGGGSRPPPPPPRGRSPPRDRRRSRSRSRSRERGRR